MRLGKVLARSEEENLEKVRQILYRVLEERCPDAGAVEGTAILDAESASVDDENRLSCKKGNRYRSQGGTSMFAFCASHLRRQSCC